MTGVKAIRWLCLLAVVAAGAGCNNSQEIPLAKVPPPPPDFGKPVVSPKTPRGGSPENATQLNR